MHPGAADSRRGWTLVSVFVHLEIFERSWILLFISEQSLSLLGTSSIPPPVCQPVMVCCSMPKGTMRKTTKHGIYSLFVNKIGLLLLGLSLEAVNLQVNCKFDI